MQQKNAAKKKKQTEVGQQIRVCLFRHFATFSVTDSLFTKAVVQRLLFFCTFSQKINQTQTLFGSGLDFIRLRSQKVSALPNVCETETDK